MQDTVGKPFKHLRNDIHPMSLPQRKEEQASEQTPNLLRQMHLSESTSVFFVCAEMAKLVHSKAPLFCVLGCLKTLSSWAAWWDGAQSMLSLFSFYPQHTPEISAPLQILSKGHDTNIESYSLRIVSLKANIWSRQAWALEGSRCSTMFCIIIKSRSL